jgi:hypothetical protein
MKKSGRFHWWGPLVCCALYGAGAAGHAAARPSARANPWPSEVSQRGARASGQNTAQLTGRLRALFGRLKSLPSTKWAGTAPAIKGQIDATLTAYVAALLARRPEPSPQRIQRDLDRGIATATWEAVFGLSPKAADADFGSNPRRLAFVVRGSGSASDFYAAGFSVGYGNVFSTRVHAFAPQAGKYRSVGPVSKLDGAVSGALRLRSFAPHELRVMVWCLHIGSPEALTSVALYKFDGKALQTVWLRQDVPGAKVALRGRLVVIESHWPVLHRSGATFHYEQKFYRQVPAGLKLVKTERWVES